MFDFSSIDHVIQKHILGYLMSHREARFSEMRPPKTDTNLYSYHLKILIKQGYVNKLEKGYTLGIKGSVYVDRVSSTTTKLRPQPKIITMLVIQNEDGDVLMYKKWRQPFIDLWTVPHGKVHNDDISVEASARREMSDKVHNVPITDLRHVGDSYIHVLYDEQVAISTLVHIFYGTTNAAALPEHMQWVQPLRIADATSAPGIVEIVQFALISKQYFFEEIVTNWR
jgi:ADP-ribose pyrophosphatase YjhB (NUDIX family)